MCIVDSSRFSNWTIYFAIVLVHVRATNFLKHCDLIHLPSDNLTLEK